MSEPTSPTKGERALIARIGRELAPPGVAANAIHASAVPFGDDMASLAPRVSDLLWTSDMLMDGVDFESDRHSWRDIGQKAMAVNLSDCAAMAASPIGALLSVALCNEISSDNALDLFRGCRDCAAEFGCAIMGGDTNSWDRPTVISITVAARLDDNLPAVRRDGARVGDRVYVSGPTGGSILGRHLTPQPRIEPARALNRAFRPHAMIDISDGLALDLWRVCEASGCGAVVQEAALDAVIHADAHELAKRTGRPAREHALYDGEDFELIVVLAPEVAEDDAVAAGLLPLGEITADKTLQLRQSADAIAPLEIRGWEHFRG